MKLEKATRKRRGGRVSQTAPSDPWIELAVSIFQSIETVMIPAVSRTAILPPSSMTLRERKPASYSAAQLKASPQHAKAKVKSDDSPLTGSESVDTIVESLQGLDLDKNELSASGSVEVKKLPRVILKVKDPQNV